MARKQIINPLVGFAQRSIGPYANRIGAATYARHVARGSGSLLGTPVLDFSDISEWTLSGAGASIEQDTEFVRTGSASMVWSATASGQNRSADKNVDNWDMSGDTGFWISSYLDHTTASGLTIYMSPEPNIGGGSGRWIATEISVGEVKEGWTLRWVSKDVFTVLDGAPTWNDPIQSIRIRINGTDTGVRKTILDGVWLGPGCQQSTVSFTFDDGFNTVPAAVDYANAKGMLCSCFIIPDLVGAGLYMDTGDIDDLYAAGNDIGGHYQTNLSTVPEEQIAPIIASVKSYLETNGWTRASRYWAWPMGEYGDTNENWDVFYAACDDNQILRSYSIEKGLICKSLGWENIHNINRGVNLNSGTTLQDAKDAVDDAEKYGGLMIFYGHKIDAVADSTTWTVSDWQALVDYVETKNVLIKSVTAL